MDTQTDNRLFHLMVAFLAIGALSAASGVVALTLALFDHDEAAAAVGMLMLLTVACALFLTVSISADVLRRPR